MPALNKSVRMERYVSDFNTPPGPWKCIDRESVTVNVPVLNSVERLLVGDVVHEKETHGAAVVGSGDGPISLLTGRVLGETQSTFKQINSFTVYE